MLSIGEQPQIGLRVPGCGNVKKRDETLHVRRLGRLSHGLATAWKVLAVWIPKGITNTV